MEEHSEPTLNPACLEDITVGKLSGQYERLGSGRSDAQLSQTRVPLQKLHTAKAVFQPREKDTESGFYASSPLFFLRWAARGHAFEDRESG